MESRELMSVASAAVTRVLVDQTAVAYFPPPPPTAAGLALINGLPNASVRSAALADYTRDGQLTRNDMMDIFSKATNQYSSIVATAVGSLETLVANGPTVAMPNYVQNLASKVIFDSSAAYYYRLGLLDYNTSTYQGGGALGKPSQTIIEDADLPAHNSKYLLYQKLAAQSLGQELNNFFLGQAHPDASFTSNGTTVTPNYTLPANLPLFNGTPSYQDVVQGAVGDCWLMASLAEVADRNPAIIRSMFIDNGDGTFTVRFYNNGVADYVTVDKFLPNGGRLYDRPQSDLWVALAEKAYAQENAAGWLGSSQQGVSSYQALSGGYPAWALPAITCMSATATPVLNILGVPTVGGIVTAWSQGQLVVLCTDSPSSTSVVPNHCYALVGYSAGSFTLFNPWGISSTSYPGLVSMDVLGVMQNFSSWTVAGAAAGPSSPQIIPMAFAPKPETTVTVLADQTPWSLRQHTADVFETNAGRVDDAVLQAICRVKTHSATFALAETLTDVLGSPEPLA
jgi:hypothetical protein